MILWRTLGRTCLTFKPKNKGESFGRRVLSLAKDTVLTTDMDGLYKYLTVDQQLRLTVQDLGMINAALFRIKRLEEDSELEHLLPCNLIRQAWNSRFSSSPTEEMELLIGASCIDQKVRKLYQDAASDPNPIEALTALEDSPPGFKLAAAEKEGFAAFFGQELVQDNLTRIHEEGWVIPLREEGGIWGRRVCAGNFFPDPDEDRAAYLAAHETSVGVLGQLVRSRAKFQPGFEISTLELNSGLGGPVVMMPISDQSQLDELIVKWAERAFMPPSGSRALPSARE